MYGCRGGALGGLMSFPRSNESLSRDCAQDGNVVSEVL